MTRITQADQIMLLLRQQLQRMADSGKAARNTRAGAAQGRPGTDAPTAPDRPFEGSAGYRMAARKRVQRGAGIGQTQRFEGGHQRPGRLGPRSQQGRGKLVLGRVEPVALVWLDIAARQPARRSEYRLKVRIDVGHGQRTYR